ncbi:MAG: PP2C family protein-serine/threonine phosphatase, partial [Chloroflexia bacterium]
NQDQVLASLTFLPTRSGPIPLGIFIVADGMGGHAGGATASMRAVEVVAAHLLRELLLPVLHGGSPEAIQDALRGAVYEANRQILSEAQEQGNDMGTTLTGALLLGERCYVAHVGDSRLYTYGPEGLRCRTRDHSMVARLLEMGQISEEEARHHPRRNYLYQAVGQQEALEVEMASFPLDCSHLLLCSDGLWGSLADEEIASVLQGTDDPQEACDRLVERANAAGGEDNISVIVVALPRGTSA